MNNGYIVSSDLKTGDRRATVVTTTPMFDRSNGSKRSERRRSDGRHPKQASDPRSIVARQFVRMSKAHDRIRMKVLAASLVRPR